MSITRNRFPQAWMALVVLAMTLASSGPAQAIHIVHGVMVAPASPAALENGTNVEIAFEYETDEAAGVRIWFRPFTDGSLTPSYSAHGSSTYHGTGSGTGFFTISAGDVLVDHIRVQMWNLDQSVLLFEEFYPVRYHFAASGEITHIESNPPWPASLDLEDHVEITFDYETPEQDGVLIFFRPLAGGDLAPGYGAHASPVHPMGSGSGVGWFTILTGESVVDGIRVQMTDPTQELVFHEFDFPVEYFFQATPTAAGTWGCLKARFR